MKLTPLNDHVVIEALDAEVKTKSGIVLPDSAEKEKPVKGTVLFVGPGKLSENGTRLPMSVKVGDTVLFKKYGPDEVELDSKKYLIGEESDILAIIQ